MRYFPPFCTRILVTSEKVRAILQAGSDMLCFRHFGARVTAGSGNRVTRISWAILLPALFRICIIRTTSEDWFRPISARLWSLRKARSEPRSRSFGPTSFSIFESTNTEHAAGVARPCNAQLPNVLLAGRFLLSRHAYLCAVVKTPVFANVAFGYLLSCGRRSKIG
jgi:hypothetical protein